VIGALLVLLAGFTGCGEERAVKVMQEADRRQAEQNDRMAGIIHDEAGVRQEVTKLQTDLHNDLATIAAERSQLENERREIASRREWALFLTPALETVAIIAALIYCGYIVAHGFRSDSGADREVAELLIASSKPALSPPLPAPSRVLRLPAPRAEAAKAARN
jgi:hypothetical protein